MGRLLDFLGAFGGETRLSFKTGHLLPATSVGAGVGVISIVGMILCTEHCSVKALRGDGGVSTSHGLKAVRNLGLEALFSLTLHSNTALGFSGDLGLVGGSLGPVGASIGPVGGALEVDSEFFGGGACRFGLGGRLNSGTGLSLGTGGLLVVIVAMFRKIAPSVETTGAFGPICQ